MENSEITKLFKFASKGYVIIEFPEIQDYMEEEWFEKECYLLQAIGEQPFISCAYFVPIKRLKK